MRYYLIPFVIMFSLLNVSAQDIEVKKFGLWEKDQASVTGQRKDINGLLCDLEISIESDLL